MPASSNRRDSRWSLSSGAFVPCADRRVLANKIWNCSWCFGKDFPLSRQGQSEQFLSELIQKLSEVVHQSCVGSWGSALQFVSRDGGAGGDQSLWAHGWCANSIHPGSGASRWPHTPPLPFHLTESSRFCVKPCPEQPVKYCSYKMVLTGKPVLVCACWELESKQSNTSFWFRLWGRTSLYKMYFSWQISSKMHLYGNYYGTE